jgi:lipopolysaccharide/colanic/teichoic acid biosynthesis glycosyltransferase
MMTWLFLTLTAAIVNLLLAECFDWLPWVSRRIIHCAARHLPPEHRTRYQDEWLAELEAIPGLRVSRLAFAVRVLLSSSDTRDAISPGVRIYFSTPMKRLADLAFAGVMLAVLAPMFAAIALAIKLTSSGSVLCGQESVGFEETRFQLLRFRTARSVAGSSAGRGAESAQATTPRRTKDRGLTRVGRFLRRYSLDELPQFFNVLRGDMSLIGPRPMRAGDNVLLEDWHRRRHFARPGITGLWQIDGCRSLTFDDMVRLDLRYIEEWSLRQELSILARTVTAVLPKRH